MALAHGILGKQGYTRRSTCPPPCTRTHILGRTYALVHMLAAARSHAHTQKYVMFIAFPRQQWFRERALLLRLCTLPFLLRNKFFCIQKRTFS